jgi:hypothetical protein
MQNEDIEIIKFSNQTAKDKKLLRKFVNFHWKLYENESRFIPLLDYEFLGSGLLGITGWFHPDNLFFKHGEMAFFLAQKKGTVLGRTCAFVNHNHNKYYHDKVGFFGFFESKNDQPVVNALLDAAAVYLKTRGMESMRGPQNFPINESTPGALVEGFDTLPYIYYHFNYPYYEILFKNYGMEVIKKVVSMAGPTNRPIENRLLTINEKVKAIYSVTLETFSRKRWKVLRQYMFEIYNEAWQDNWGFVPFEKEEFFSNLEGIKLIWDPKMFIFAFVKGEPAAFIGAVPNILEKMTPIPGLQRAELLRAAKMLLTKGSIKSYRTGYFGIRPKYRKIGLDAVLFCEGKRYVQSKNYQACDVGWILEDNELVLRVSRFMGGERSRTYAIFQKDID